MATQLQIRRGTSTQVAAFTGAEGEIVVNTTNDSVHVNDGSTAGGFEMARADLNNVSDTDLNAALTGNTVSALTITTLTLGATAITATGAELNFVDGVTSAIQTQIDTKAPLASPTFTGTVTASEMTVSDTDDIRLRFLNATTFKAGLQVVTSTGDMIAGSAVDDLAIRSQANMLFSTGGNTERMRITSAGLVGIGTSSPTGNLEIATSASDTGVDLVLDGNKTSNGGIGSIIFNNNGDSVGMIRSNRASANDAADMLFYTQATGGANTERMRIDSSGNLLVGKTTADNTTAGTTIYGAVAKGAASFVRDAGNTLVLNRLTSDGEILAFRKDGTTVGSIGAYDGRPYLASSTVGIRISNALFPSNTSGVITDGAMNIGGSSGRFQDLYLSGQAIAGDGSVTAPSFRGTDTNTGIYFPSAGVTAISRNGVEGCRLDASGNVLVGTTSTTLYDATSGGGVMLDPNGPTTIARESQTALYVNRTSTHGDMVQFRKDGVTHGRLSNDGTYFFIAGGAAGGTHSGIRFINNASVRPCTSSGGNLDNTVVFGASNARWELVYSVGGTTATSDRNEKQDIEELTDAEQRVAVAAKGLLRKYRWKSAVAEKGDDARIHFGIIAQDLQDAFAAEGLDAARYGMWCSDTFWVDSEGETYDTQEEAPEGATEQTRLGVRYAQLLAFIIAAI